MSKLSELEENYKSGWIKIFRSIKKHWIYPKNRPFTQFEAWLTILIEVNHSGEKVRLGNELFECKRGEKLYSLETWAKMFNWDKSKVRRFLSLLQNDSMIVLKSEQKTTRLIVCNYETYQSEQNASETQVKRKRNASETQTTPIEECKEYKNEKEPNNTTNEVVKNWKTDFEIYKSELNEVYHELIFDSEYIATQEKLNPNIDIQLTLEKSVVNFWSTEAGWKNKKSSRSKEINWKSTLTNSISQPMNKVYKQKQNGQTFNTNRKDKNSETIRAAENLIRDIASEIGQQV